MYDLLSFFIGYGSKQHVADDFCDGGIGSCRCYCLFLHARTFDWRRCGSWCSYAFLECRDICTCCFFADLCARTSFGAFLVTRYATSALNRIASNRHFFCGVQFHAILVVVGACRVVFREIDVHARLAYNFFTRGLFRVHEGSTHDSACVLEL